MSSGSKRLLGTLAVLLAAAAGFALATHPWQEKPGRTQFAEDRDAPPQALAFNRERAMSYLKQICDLGTRISGSDGMARQQELLRKHFEAAGLAVELQPFQAQQRSQPKPVAMANLIARWKPDRPRRLLLSAHYDTRPIADQEPDRRDWTKPFIAANDGAAGPALLMELALHLPKIDPALGVDLVLYDGEEYIFDSRPQEQGGDRYFFGSEHFAQQYAARKDRRQTYAAAVVVDLIAGKDARFPYEQYSFSQAGALCREIWGVAAELKVKAFVPEIGPAVLDDHLALLRVGIPAVDIIDFDYPYWHRLADVPANCSAESMEQVARVLAAWMRKKK